MMKNILLDFIIGSKALLLFSPLYKGIGTILLFHRVAPEHNTNLIDGLQVTPEYLEACINYFKEHDYQILSIEDIYEQLMGKRVNNKFVVFTFDDGYVDIFKYVYPLFKKYNLPFTTYITPGFQEKKRFMWWDLLNDLIFNNNYLKYEFKNYDFHLPCLTWTHKKQAMDHLIKLFMDIQPKDRHIILDSIFKYYNYDYFIKQEELVLSWDQIIQMSLDPIVTIGAHTMSHLKLNSLPINEVKEELVNCKYLLESKIGKKVEHLAYPHGSKTDVGKKEFDVVKQCGFKTATTTRTGNIFLEHRDYLECLPRIRPRVLIDGSGREARYLTFWTSGAVPALRNRGKRIITD
jgi:peptidoglycan/xylan/chitin deacetylase (PgdA/CDA1 family)